MYQVSQVPEIFIENGGHITHTTQQLQAVGHPNHPIVRWVGSQVIHVTYKNTTGWHRWTNTKQTLATKAKVWTIFLSATSWSKAKTIEVALCWAVISSRFVSGKLQWCKTWKMGGISLGNVYYLAADISAHVPIEDSMPSIICCAAGKHIGTAANRLIFVDSFHQRHLERKMRMSMYEGEGGSKEWRRIDEATAFHQRNLERKMRMSMYVWRGGGK